MRSMHLMPVIALNSFEMSKTKIKVAPYWIKIDILKPFPGYFLYLSFGTVDVKGQLLSNKRISDEDKCPRVSLFPKRGQIIIFNFPNSQQKSSVLNTLPVTTRPTISEVGRVVASLFELDLPSHERQSENISYLH